MSTNIPMSDEDLLRELAKYRSCMETIIRSSEHLRTPLGSVMAQSTLLFETELSDNQNQIAIALKKAAFSLLSVIDDIFTLAKIATNELAVSPTFVDMEVVFAETESSVAELAQKQAVDFSYELVSGSRIVMKSDAGLLQRIVTGLSRYAILESSTKRVVLSAKLYPSENQVCMAVGPAKIGWRTQDTAHIREYFADTTDQVECSGMISFDLVVLKKISEALGGKVMVKGENTSSVEFVVTFPCMNDGLEQVVMRPTTKCS